MRKRLSLLLLLAVSFIMFMPVKAYAETESAWERLGKAMSFAEGSETSSEDFTVEDGEYGRTITLLKDITAMAGDSAMTVPFGKNVTLMLNGHTLDRGLTSGVIDGHLINVKGSLSINGEGTICGGNNTNDGGAIYISEEGSLNISNTTICNNKGYDGGAIYNMGTLTMQSLKVEGNTSSDHGGAIYNMGNLSAKLCVFDSNTSEVCGGTIYNDLGGFADLINCNLTNSTAKYGGAIYIIDGTVQFTGFLPYSEDIGIISECKADQNGGAVDVTNHGRFEMSNAKISRCSATNGGAIFVEHGSEQLKGTAQLTSSTIEACEASYLGGGICSFGAIGLNGMTIINNKAAENGGGIYLNEDGSIFLGSTTNVTGNTVNGKANNLYLSDKLLMVKFGSGEDVWVPSAGMQIGVTTKTGPNAKKPVDLIYGAKAEYKDYVLSDNAGYEVKFKNDKLMLAISHTHDFALSSGDNCIKATCKGSCEDFYDDNPITLTLLPQSELKYDGSQKQISFRDGEKQAWKEAGLIVPEIEYYKKSASGGYDKIDNAPVDAGIYQAKIDVNSTIATYDFEIQKKEITVSITPNGGEYKKTITPATATFEGLVEGDDIKPVLTYTSKNYDSTEAPTEVGTYTVTASLPKEASNYELTGKVTAEFVISGGITPTPDPKPTPTPTPTPTFEDPTVIFTDVAKGKWYSKKDGSIAYVTAYKIMNGTGDKKFDPEGDCTREMFVQILYNLEGKPGAGSSNPFKDVKSGKWYYDAVTWAVANDVTKGTSADTFGIGGNVTREQMAQFLMNYAKKRGYDITARADLSGFPDVAKVSGWAKELMSWANANGIINGKAKEGVNYLDPKGNASRAEVAQMIMNFQKKFGK